MEKKCVVAAKGSQWVTVLVTLQEGGDGVEVPVGV